MFDVDKPLPEPIAHIKVLWDEFVSKVACEALIMHTVWRANPDGTEVKLSAKFNHKQLDEPIIIDNKEK